MLAAVLTLVHGARRLAWTEATDARLLVVALEHAIRLTRQAVGVCLDLEDDARAGLARDGVPERALGGRGGHRCVAHGSGYSLARCSSTRSTRATKSSARPSFSATSGNSIRWTSSHW